MKGEHLLTIKLKGEFVDLNTYIRADRTNRYAGGSIKQEETDRVIWETKKYKGAITEKVHIRFDWYVKDRKKDADNISFSKKFLMDGLVKAGVMINDTQRYVTSFEDWIHVDKDTRVEIRFFKATI